MMHATQEARLATFEGKSDIFPVSIQKLAAAGFCWTPFTKTPASVRCEDCEVVLKDWEGQTDPVDAHKHARPDCPFVKSLGAVDPLAVAVSPGAADDGRDTKRRKIDHTKSNLLIDISEDEVAITQASQTPAAQQKLSPFSNSESLNDLMEIFGLEPTKKIPPVNVLVGALINRTVAPASDNDNDIPYSATTRPIPKDLKTCRHCQTVFEDRDKLFQHVYTDCGRHPEKCPNPFPCRVCRDNFITKKLLKQHLKLVHSISLWY